MDRNTEAVCLDCSTAALSAAADRLGDRCYLMSLDAFLAACNELAVNLIETGQATCPAHRPAIARAAS